MIPLPLLLRDAAVATVLFAGVGELFGQGASVAAGAIAGLINLTGMVLVVRGEPALLLGRLALQNITAFASLALILSVFHPLAAMIGLLAPLASITARTLMPPSGVRT